MKFFKKYSDDRIIRWFKKVCVFEAITCFLLYCVAMVWKRYDPDGFLSTAFIILVGNIHGIFFTSYLLLSIPCRKIYSWDDEDFVFVIISAFFPFATIWIDKKIARFDKD